MKSVAAKVCSCLRRDARCRHRGGREQRGRRAIQRSARRSEGRLEGRGRGRAQHEADHEPAEARGLLRSGELRAAVRFRLNRRRSAAGHRRRPPRSERPAAMRRMNSPAGLNFANSDIAFGGNHRLHGQFPRVQYLRHRAPEEAAGCVASMVCPGGQGDMSVHGNLLFMSVEQTRGRVDCGTQGVDDTVSAERFRGVRIFDISDLKKPKQVAGVQTCRGSHTHTLVIDPKDKGTSTSTDRAPARCVRVRSSPVVPASTRKRIRTPRSSASTSSRCRLPR